MTKRKGTRDDAGSTRAAILDAAEAILREDGYSAVTSRAIAEKAELKSRLVHYYFGSMDDLFIAVMRRIEDRYFSVYLNKLAAGDSAREMWSSILSNIDAGVMQELAALALHRKEIQAEVARVLDRARQMDIAMMERAIKEFGIKAEGMTPTVLALLMAGVVRVLTAEGAIGVTRGHKELLAYLQTLADGGRRT